MELYTESRANATIPCGKMRHLIVWCVTFLSAVQRRVSVMGRVVVPLGTAAVVDI